MTSSPHDQFAKQYLKGMLLPFAQEVIVSYELPVGEAQQVDVWFMPQPRQPIVSNQPWAGLSLGRLGQMTIAPALLEVFRNPISDNDLFSCIEKLCRVRADWKRTAKREKMKPHAASHPHLWLIVPTASDKRLSGCNAILKKAWGEGFFFLGDTLQIGFVVVHQLPVVPETLLLRLLGKASVQRQAIIELLELPEQPLKAIVLENLIKLEVMLKSRQTPSQDEQELILNLEPVYEEWRNRVEQEGRQEEGRSLMEGMLIAKFGEVGILKTIVPKLLELSAIDRAKAVMSLSKEELMQAFSEH